MRTGLAIALGLAGALFAPAALAQDTQGTGEGTATVEPPKVTTSVNTTTTTTTPAVAHAETKDDGVTDHEKVVGHLGVGYLGLTQIPIGSGGGGGAAGGFSHTKATLDAPVIGVRYWLSEKMGIDAGLGFTMFSSSNDTVNNNVTTTTDGPAAFGVAVHGGLPLAFAYAKHYKFLLVPEINVGYAHRGEKQTGTPAPPDIVRTGLRIDAGARVGTEIQFGFIGIPELALQASVGLNFRYQNWKSQQDAGPPVVPSERSSSDTQTSIGTTVQADPWALFVNNISAIYYFP